MANARARRYFGEARSEHADNRADSEIKACRGPLIQRSLHFRFKVHFSQLCKFRLKFAIQRSDNPLNAPGVSGSWSGWKARGKAAATLRRTEVD
jgi:hypothetical protein